MGLMKDIMIYTCEMWHQKKSVTEIIEELSREYQINFTERDVVDTLIEYYKDIFEEEPQPQKDKNIGADFKVGDIVVFMRDADGVERGSCGRIKSVYNGFIWVYVDDICATKRYRVNQSVPFEKLNYPGED